MSLRLRGHHPLRPGIQPGSPRTWFCDSRPARRRRDRASHDTGNATPDGYHAQPVWSDPLSLATTHGVSLPAGTEMFHFPAFPSLKRYPAMTPDEFPHSEILGSKLCWQLPEAYRSLIRLSSAQRAKAFTICSVSGFSSQKTVHLVDAKIQNDC